MMTWNWKSICLFNTYNIMQLYTFNYYDNIIMSKKSK